MPAPPSFSLTAAARQAMIARGFEPDYPPDALAMAQSEATHPAPANPAVADLRSLLWSSIDNDTSRDLDQIEYVEPLPDGSVKVLIGIADVSAFVPADSALDRHALHNTASIYTGVATFMMLPPQLSAGATSLLEDRDRVAIVIEFTVDADNAPNHARIYPALVRNRAQLAYRAVGDWLAGTQAAQGKLADPALQQQLRLQHQVAQQLRLERSRHGALNLDLDETTPILADGHVIGIEASRRNAATDLIEDFMIAANGVVARHLAAHGFSSIRRIVRKPRRWDRIVALAAALGASLPADPDPKPLNDFLCERKSKDPEHFPDLSLAIVKLMGPGEYVAERASDPPEGHFGLAVEDYTHSTAPNRRYPDLVTQRLLKAIAANEPSPYTDDQLSQIANRCTLMGDAERKLERDMRKKIAAVAMAGHIGESFDAVVTGVKDNTFVRTISPQVEGMLVQGHTGLDVGDRLTVRLVRTDPARGFIDFARIPHRA